MSSSSHTTIMDQRGFLFALPHLGLPEMTGEWRVLKAAVATKDEALDLLLNDKTLKTPLRSGDTPNDTALVPIEFEGALWVLELPKPASTSPTSGAPEFFSVKVKRFFPDALGVPRRKLPSECDWVFFPMSVYTEQVAGRALQQQGEEDKQQGFVFEAGPASAVQDMKERAARDHSSSEGRETSKWEALSGSIFNDEWCRAVKINTMLEDAKRGDVSGSGGHEGLQLRLRVHPAEDDEFKSMDYAVVSKEDKEGSPIEAGRWRPLPPEATKPGGERHWVNIARAGKGKRALTKEEWERR